MLIVIVASDAIAFCAAFIMKMSIINKYLIE
jgi:hypothetical protein